MLWSLSHRRASVCICGSKCLALPRVARFRLEDTRYGTAPCRGPTCLTVHGVFPRHSFRHTVAHRRRIGAWGFAAAARRCRPARRAGQRQHRTLRGCGPPVHEALTRQVAGPSAWHLAPTAASTLRVDAVRAWLAAAASSRFPCCFRCLEAAWFWASSHMKPDMLRSPGCCISSCVSLASALALRCYGSDDGEDDLWFAPSLFWVRVRSYPHCTVDASHGVHS